MRRAVDNNARLNSMAVCLHWSKIGKKMSHSENAHVELIIGNAWLTNHPSVDRVSMQRKILHSEMHHYLSNCSSALEMKFNFSSTDWKRMPLWPTILSWSTHLGAEGHQQYDSLFVWNFDKLNGIAHTINGVENFNSQVQRHLSYSDISNHSFDVEKSEERETTTEPRINNHFKDGIITVVVLEKNEFARNHIRLMKPWNVHHKQMSGCELKQQHPINEMIVAHFESLICNLNCTFCEASIVLTAVTDTLKQNTNWLTISQRIQRIIGEQTKCKVLIGVFSVCCVDGQKLCQKVTLYSVSRFFFAFICQQCAEFSSYSLRFRIHTLRLAHNGFSHFDFLLWTVAWNRCAFYHRTIAHSIHYFTYFSRHGKEYVDSFMCWLPHAPVHQDDDNMRENIRKKV